MNVRKGNSTPTTADTCRMSPKWYSRLSIVNSPSGASRGEQAGLSYHRYLNVLPVDSKTRLALRVITSTVTSLAANATDIGSMNASHLRTE